MGGLRNICRLYGGMVFQDQHGNKTEYVWDYALDEPRLKSEMDAEATAKSERAKWMKVKAEMEKKKQTEIEF